MRKALKIAASVMLVTVLSACLFYCLVAGAGEGATIYVIMAAILSIAISVALCLGFLYIRHLQKLLKELSEIKE